MATKGVRAGIEFGNDSAEEQLCFWKGLPSRDREDGEIAGLMESDAPKDLLETLRQSDWQQTGPSVLSRTAE